MKNASPLDVPPPFNYSPYPRAASPASSPRNSAGEAAGLKILQSESVPMNQTSFKDLAGNDWEIEPNHGTFSSILEKTKINLRSLEKFGENWVKIISDDDVAEAVIWAAIADHAEGGDIRGWQCHMSGATLAEAIDALLNSICECFPKKATFYREIADKLRDRLQVVYDEAAELISKLPNDVEELHRLAVVRVRANATEPNETSRQP